jgi:catechol 2,3-dioxygenase-like lactoylglutathione lyase family enzyme
MTPRPEGARFLSGVLLVSEQPERLARFYRDVLDIPLVAEQHGDTEPHWGCELGDTHFAIHPVQDYPEDPAVAPGPIKLAFEIFDLRRMLAWLEDQGVPLCYPPRQLGAESLMTAIRDPDGNLIELTQLGAAWLQHLQARRAGGQDPIQQWRAHLDAVKD